MYYGGKFNTKNAIQTDMKRLNEKALKNYRYSLKQLLVQMQDNVGSNKFIV